jgi:probable rRNA maturation factor
VAIEVFCEDEQGEEFDRAGLVALARAVVVDLGLTGAVELTLTFVDELRIAELNAQYLGHQGATDVLSFGVEEEPLAASPPPGAPLLLGDVVICPAVARANAPGHAGSYPAEMALLVVHGILHLFGHDHELDDAAEAMEALEVELLARHFEAAS